MNEKESDGPCEKCGYSNDAPYLPSYLAPGTILNDRYIVVFEQTAISSPGFTR